MTKLVTDNQARELARLARNVSLPRSTFQAALVDGTAEKWLRRLIPLKLAYPDFVKERLTPELEVLELTNPGEIGLWFDPRQQSETKPSGHEVYVSIKQNGLLENSLSYGHLKWLEVNPDKIPTECKGKWLYAWASIARNADGRLCVPCLICDVSKPCVLWAWLGLKWCDGEPAGFRKEI